MSERKLVFVCRASDLVPDSVKAFEIGERQIAVYNISGQYYATDDICSHGQSSLASGFLEGENIECAAHFGAFHIPTGKAVAPPCSIPLKTYPIALQDGDVFVEV